MELHGFKDLIVYKKSYKLAIDLFYVTKDFPKDEKFSLTDQIRRSSRSVPVNIAESWAKRKYTKAFVNKITDALGEEFETEVWLKMSLDFSYLIQKVYDEFSMEYDEVRKMLISIMNNPEKFCI